MNTAKKGDWVQITSIVLPVGSRAAQVPEDTQACDLVMWVKGTLQRDANLGDTVEVITATGRKETGTLSAVNPGYTHGYGRFIPELIQVQSSLRELMFGGSE